MPEEEKQEKKRENVGEESNLNAFSYNVQFYFGFIFITVSHCLNFYFSFNLCMKFMN